MTLIGEAAAQGTAPCWTTNVICKTARQPLCQKDGGHGAPGRIRTCDTRFRKPLLYPLSYEGGGSK